MDFDKSKAIRCGPNGEKRAKELKSRYQILISGISIVLAVTYSFLLSGCPSKPPTSPAPTPTPAYSYYGQIGSSAPATGGNNGQFNFPIGVAVDSSGNIFVTDTKNNRVQRFDSAFSYTLQWGSSAPATGGAVGQFNYPSGIAMDTFTLFGFLYVVDTDNNRIQKFNSSGTSVTQWGTYGTSNGQFELPYGVAVDASGYVYVTDTWNNRVQKFDSNGVYQIQWGNGAPASGSGPGQFNEPAGIAADNQGYIYVSDWGNSRIQKFNSSGVFQKQWGPPCGDPTIGNLCSPRGIAIDPWGNVIVADQIENAILKYDSNGNFLGLIGNYVFGGGSGPGQISNPHGIAVDSSGNVYVADNGNNRIEIFKKN